MGDQSRAIDGEAPTSEIQMWASHWWSPCTMDSTSLPQCGFCKEVVPQG